MAITPQVCERAGLLEPTHLRSLDAIHLDTTLQLGDDLDGFVTYDQRLAAAAADNAVTTIAPA